MYRSFIVVLLLICLCQNLFAQTKVMCDFFVKSNINATVYPKEWYVGKDAKAVADSISKFKANIRYWNKRVNLYRGVACFDNWLYANNIGFGVALNMNYAYEMQHLAKVYCTNRDIRYRDAFVKSLLTILDTQSDDGAWKRFNVMNECSNISHVHIAYGQSSMVAIMNLLLDIFTNSEYLEPLNLSSEIKQNAAKAFNKAVSCILNAQIIVNNKATIWGDQYIVHNLSHNGNLKCNMSAYNIIKSVDFVRLLMRVDLPSQEMINAIVCAVDWFEQNKIVTVCFKERNHGPKILQSQVINNNMLEPTWALFYNLNNAMPLVLDKKVFRQFAIVELGSKSFCGRPFYTNEPRAIIEEFSVWSKIWLK
jgi:pectinesterase